MLNMIQMDIFRMFKTKSLYVIAIIMFAVTLLTTVMMASMATEITDMQQETEAMQEENTVGIVVSPNMEEGKKVSVFDMVYANIQGKMLALYLVIYAVIFATADITSGYIKNFAGQVKNRWKLVISKAITLFFYTVLMMVLFVVLQAISTFVAFGYLEMGNLSDMLAYIGMQTILHYGLLCVCMAFSIVFRHNLCSMSLAICICCGITNLLFGYIDRVLGKIGIENFQTIKYTITGRIGSLPMELSGSDVGKGMLVAAVFILVFVGISSYIFEKRDV